MIIFMRIDKLLCELNIGTRSQVKELLKRGQISVNGEIIKRPEEKVDELTAEIVYGGKAYHYRPFVYYMMNKPADYLCANHDKYHQCVIDLIGREDCYCLGRLDIDTTGLLIITNDTSLSKKLLLPRFKNSLSLLMEL